jgi:hypothetical protein
MKSSPIVSLLLVSLSLTAQDSLRHTSARKVLLLGGATYTVSMVALGKMWYGKGERQAFTFFNDWPEWKQVDKAGHFYTAFHLSAVSAKAMKNFQPDHQKAELYGALTGFLLLLPIEIFDGFSARYGASLPDAAANMAGSFFYWGQIRAWNEIRIHPKFSFQRTPYPALRDDSTLGNSLITELLKDYNGQTYWISLDMDKFISIPRWFNVAIGYGATDMVYGRSSQNHEAGYWPVRQIYLGLDVDVSHLKTRSKGLNTFLYLLNLIKLPAPAFEFSSGKVHFHWLKF